MSMSLKANTLLTLQTLQTFDLIMQYIADLHIHSKYSRATSKQMDLENINKWAKIKGINILAALTT